MLKQFLRPALAWLLCLSVGAAIYIVLPHGKDSWLGRKLEEPMWTSRSGLYDIVQRDRAIAPGYNGRLSYNQFNAVWREYLKDQTNHADMLALCDRVLTQDAAGDAFYRARVYTARGFVFFIQDNLTAAEENARLAMAEDSRHGFGQYLMYYILERQGLAAEAADMLKAAWKGGEFATSDKKWFDEKIAALRVAAVVIESRALDAEFIADEAAATRKYFHKDITVRGKITGIETIPFPKFELESAHVWRKVTCDFFLEGAPGIVGIKEGQTVTVYGNCLGISHGELVIVDAKVIKVEY